jgi:hypothetical protein
MTVAFTKGQALGLNPFSFRASAAQWPDWGNLQHSIIARLAAGQAETGPLRRGWREGELRTFAGDSAKAERSAAQHAHPQRAFRLVNRCVSAQS